VSGPTGWVAVGLPAVCPSCGGELCVERVACQWQKDLPAAQPTEICRYEVGIGRCQVCHRRVQPRHPQQTSDALGAAAVLAQLGVQATNWRAEQAIRPAVVADLVIPVGLARGPVSPTRRTPRSQVRYCVMVAELSATPPPW
jgi:hypothetical protein